MVRSDLPRPPRENRIALGAEVRRHARADPAASQPARGKTVHLIRRTASALYEKALEVAPNDAALQIKLHICSSLRAI
jgi:hypothetical protein